MTIFFITVTILSVITILTKAQFSRFFCNSFLECFGTKYFGQSEKYKCTKCSRLRSLLLPDVVGERTECHVCCSSDPSDSSVCQTAGELCLRKVYNYFAQCHS